MKCPFAIKVCTKCKRILVANEINFKKCKKGKYKLASQCKICDKEYREEYKNEIAKYKKQYYIDNKNKLSEKRKQYYQENKKEIIEKCKQYYKEHKEEKKWYDKQYRQEHKEEKRQYHKQYREEHREEILKNQKQWYEDNPDKVFNQHTNRRLLEEKQGNGITKDQWLEMMEFFNWRCAYSGIQLNKNNRSIDHIIPISLGGENEIWNLVPMLKSYNSSKYTSDMIDWYKEQEFFDIDRLLKIYEWIEYAYKKWLNK